MVDLSRIFEKHFTKNFTPLHEKYTPRKHFECFLECIAIVIDAIDRVERRPTKGKNLYTRVLHTVWLCSFTQSFYKNAGSAPRDKKPKQIRKLTANALPSVSASFECFFSAFLSFYIELQFFYRAFFLTGVQLYKNNLALYSVCSLPYFNKIIRSLQFKLSLNIA